MTLTVFYIEFPQKIPHQISKTNISTNFLQKLHIHQISKINISCDTSSEIHVKIYKTIISDKIASKIHISKSSHIKFQRPSSKNHYQFSKIDVYIKFPQKIPFYIKLPQKIPYPTNFLQMLHIHQVSKINISYETYSKIHVKIYKTNISNEISSKTKFSRKLTYQNLQPKQFHDSNPSK